MATLRRRLRPRLLAAYGLAAALVWAARPSWTTLALGAVPIVLGETLRLWATGYLHKNDALTIAGPYAFIRHPLYLGTFLIASGFAAMAWSGVALALYGIFLVIFFGYYMPYKNRIEGARLESLYGDTYRRYSVAVPALLPRLSAYRPLAAEPAAVPRWQPERFGDNHEVGTALAVALGVLGMVTRALI